MSLILNPYRYLPPAGGGAVLEDDFNGAGGVTALTSWAPTLSGTGWTLDPLSNAAGPANVQTSGVVQPAADEENLHLTYFSNPDPSSADHFVEVEMSAVSTVDDWAFHLLVRRQTNGACYLATFAGGTLYLNRMTAPGSAAAQLATASKTLGAGDRLRLKAVGSTISVDYKDGAGAWEENVISVSDANISANGKAGVSWGAYRASNRDVRVANGVTYVKVANV